MNIQDYLLPGLWDLIESNYTSRKYTNAINDAMLFLSNTLREKTDSEFDGYELVQQAFLESDPKIKLNKLVTKTERSIQSGTEHILKGFYKLIRNPRHHDVVNDTEEDSIKIILFIDYMLRLIIASKSKFELLDFKTLVFDKDAVKSQSYIDLIVSKIPNRKLYETMLEIYNDRMEADVYQINRFFISIFQRLKTNCNDDQIFSFMQIISNDLLNSNDDNERKYILYCFPEMYWKDVEEIPKQRTENRIILSIQEGCEPVAGHLSGWFATWCTHLFKYFTFKDQLYIVVYDKLNSNKKYEIIYCFKYIIKSLFESLDQDVLLKINDIKDDDLYLDYIYNIFIIIRKSISEGKEIFYRAISNVTSPLQLKDFFAESIASYVEKEHLYDEDMPF